MVRVRSPLLIPLERGTTIRVVVSTLLIALAVFVGFDMIQGLRSGTVYWATRWGHGHIDRALYPTAFWIIGATYLAGCAWFLYASVAEILYAMRRQK
jgi:hypothetical protein